MPTNREVGYRCAVNGVIPVPLLTGKKSLIAVDKWWLYHFKIIKNRTLIAQMIMIIADRIILYIKDQRKSAFHVRCKFKMRHQNMI